jgi:hypothetical protein
LHVSGQLRGERFGGETDGLNYPAEILARGVDGRGGGAVSMLLLLLLLLLLMMMMGVVVGVVGGSRTDRFGLLLLRDSLSVQRNPPVKRGQEWAEQCFQQR